MERGVDVYKRALENKLVSSYTQSCGVLQTGGRIVVPRHDSHVKKTAWARKAGPSYLAGVGSFSTLLPQIVVDFILFFKHFVNLGQVRFDQNFFTSWRFVGARSRC